MDNLTEIGRKTITANATVKRLDAPIGVKLAFIEVEGDVRYSIGDTAAALTANSGGALLQDGTKIDFKGISVYNFRMVSADGLDKSVHVTFMG